MSDRLLAIISKADTALQGAETATIERVNTALESSYKQLEKRLLPAYGKHQGNLSLLPKQRSLVILDEVSTLLSLVDTRNAESIQADFQDLLQTADDQGATLADAMVGAIANEKLADFASVPLEAVRMQAENGMSRLSRHTEEFRNKASAIVEMGLVQGHGARRVAAALRSELGITKGKAEMIARTEAVSSHNQAIAANLQRNGYELVQIFATVDDRVCATCAARNQNVYKVDEISVPFHPYCRCVIAPMSQRWVDAGLVDEEWSRQFKEGAIAELEKQKKKPNNGLSPFEKAAGLTEPPKAVWKIGVPSEMLQGSPLNKINANPKETEKVMRQVRGQNATGASLGSGDVAGTVKPFDLYIAKGRDYFNTLEGVKELDATLKVLREKVATLEASEAKEYKALEKVQEKWQAGKIDVEAFKKKFLKYQALSDRVYLKTLKAYREGEAAIVPLRDQILARGSATDAKALEEKIEVNVEKKSEEKFLRGQMREIFRASGGKGGSIESVEYVAPRAWASRENRSINAGNSFQDSPETMWHEVGHHIEFESEPLRLAAKSWIESRATGAPEKMAVLTGNSSYKASEKAYPDSFVHPYVGKIYSDGSTEVISTGMEHLQSSAAMMKLYWDDPEHLFLTLGAIVD